jgi:hypothetical protein
LSLVDRPRGRGLPYPVFTVDLELAELPISERERGGLVTLRELPESAINQLLAELNRSPESLPSVDGLSPTAVEQMIKTLKYLYETRVVADVPVPEFVSDVCEALREAEELSPNAEPQFRERLSKLLDIEALNIAAKAFTLYGEHPNVFCDARILTDMRPVFGDNVSDPPVAYIVTHTLKLEYHAAAGRLQEIYMGLASEDLVELRIALDRAEAKAKSLRTVLEATGIKFLDPQHPDR